MSTMEGHRLVFVLVACCIYCRTVTSAGSCDSFLFDTITLDDSSVDDVEKNMAAHLPSWDGIINVASRQHTSLDLAWNAPINITDLCAYRVHFYAAGVKGVSDTRHSITIKPNQLSVTVSGLSPGTQYHVFVEAVFNVTVSGSTTGRLLSYVLGVKTLGFGPDNSCNCAPWGTEGGDVNNCDATTGQCVCKNTDTTGLRCDECVAHAYMNSQLGCTSCDQCDPAASKGSCTPVKDGTDMQCNCLENFGGKHCTECVVNFYKSGSVCVPCDCNNNQNANSTPICDVNGVCLSCDFYTSGDRCQQCYRGYVGDALKRTCQLESHVGKDVAIAILVILLIVVVVALTLFLVRRCVRQQRLGRFRGMSADGGSRGSGVNFKELNEEHDVDFRQTGRKLQIISA